METHTRKHDPIDASARILYAHPLKTSHHGQQKR